MHRQNEIDRIADRIRAYEDANGYLWPARGAIQPPNGNPMAESEQIAILKAALMAAGAWNDQQERVAWKIRQKGAHGAARKL